MDEQLVVFDAGMDAQQLPEVRQDLINPHAGVVARVLPEKTQIAAGNLDAIRDLPGQPFEMVLDQLQPFAIDMVVLANALIDELQQPGDDRQRAVDVVNDAGVNLTAGSDN